ncbi:MAG: M48 family metalloprotease [Atribacterota bacterium]
MSFCANCGIQVKNTLSICPNCHLDPNNPEEIINERLKKISFEKKEKALTSKLEYPGESSSLAFSIIMMIVGILIFSTISLGLFIIFLILGLIYHRIHEAQTKAHLIRVSENNFPMINKLAKVAAYRLKTPLPPVYILENPNLNAYTSGFWGNHWIVLYSALIKQLNPEELLYVIGHEMGHIKREHATWLNLTASQGTISIPLISKGLRIIFNNWSIKSEYSADRAGLISNKKLKSCVSALLMLATGHRNVDLTSYLKEFERYKNAPLSRLSELFQTHPYIPNRIKKLKQFSEIINLILR